MKFHLRFACLRLVRSVLWTTAVVLCGMATLRGDGTPARLRFLFLDESAGAYALKVDGRYEPLTSGPYEISQPRFPKDSQPMELYKLGATLDPQTGKPAVTKVASVTPPTGMTSALVVITPRATDSGSSAKPTYDVDVYDNAPESFPARSIRILNLGHSAMAAQFGDTRSLVKPGETRLVQPSADRRNRIFSKIAVANSDGWKLLYDSITILRPEERMIGVFVYSPTGMRYIYTEQEIAIMGPPPPGHFWLTYTDEP